jgi:hypothetical protein
VKRSLAFLVLILAVGLQAFSQTRFVAVESLEVRSGTGFFASQIGTLSLGDEVTLIRESGRFSEVRFRLVSGWVASQALSPRRIAQATATHAPGEIALAGKGFGRSVEDEYRVGSGQADIDFSSVDQMESFVTNLQELQRFILDGRLLGGNP